MSIYTLAWPHPDLSPNARVHWARLAKAKKAYRTSSAWRVLSQGGKKLTAKSLQVRVSFVPPDRRKRDKDNMLAAIKAGLDGVADALGVDDSAWELTIAPVLPPDGNPRVIVEVE